MKQIRRILHATDLSPASRRAFDAALYLTKQNKAELSLMHVLSLSQQTYLAGDQTMDPNLYVQIEAQALRHAEASMSKLEAEAKKGRVQTRTAVEKGVASDRIVRFAKRNKSDLIVMGTHGRTGISKVFVGSVASRVVATAPCPVLTVRGRSR